MIPSPTTEAPASTDTASPAIAAAMRPTINTTSPPKKAPPPDIHRERGGTTLAVRTFSMAPPKTKGGYLDHRFGLPFHKGTASTARAGSQMENTGAKRSVRNTLQAVFRG